MYAAVKALEGALKKAESESDPEKGSKLFAYEVVPAMEKVRAFADGMEEETAKEYWPFPSYTDILFSVE